MYRGNQQRPLSVLREVCITLLSVVYRGNQQRTLSVLREVCITLLSVVYRGNQQRPKLSVGLREVCITSVYLLCIEGYTLVQMCHS